MTLTNELPQTNPDQDTVAALLVRRDQLQEWLDNLGEMSADVPSRVAERVRSDYQDRLAQVLDELASHVDTVTSELARLREELTSSGERYEAAVDEMEELRLRFRIGEIDQADWDARRPELEEAVASTATIREAVVTELERLEEILAQIQGEERVGTDGETDVEELPRLRLVRTEAVATAPEQDDLPEELGFLEQLDRAITAEGGAEPEHPLSDEELDTRPKPGAKCPDCGYTNDASAWYCGVCGVDLN